MHFQTIQGDRVPSLGLGTYRLTGRTCREAVKEALELGYRHVDTAQAYDNEEDVGRGIQETDVDRSELFVTTKVWMSNLAPDRVRSSTEESLKKLKLDYVDLLLIHWPSDEVPLEKTLDAMLALKDDGKTRHIGVSNFTADLVRRTLDHAPIFCNQVEYHPFLSQDALRELAVEPDFLLTAYSPIARGRVSDDKTLKEIAESHGKTPVQITLRWLIQQRNVAAIPKAASPEHRRSNFDIFDLELTEEEMDRIFSLGRGHRIVDPAWAPSW